MSLFSLLVVNIRECRCSVRDGTGFVELERLKPPLFVDVVRFGVLLDDVRDIVTPPVRGRDWDDVRETDTVARPTPALSSDALAVSCLSFRLLPNVDHV